MSSFTRSLRFERNTKTVPLNGSCCRIDCTVLARPSAPRRKSTGRVATSTRTPGGRLPTGPRSCRLQQTNDLAEKRQLDARIGAQHSAANLDFDHPTARSSTVFRHDRHKIGQGATGLGERAGSHLSTPHVKLIAVQPVAQCDRARYRSRRKALRDNRRLLRRAPVPPTRRSRQNLNPPETVPINWQITWQTSLPASTEQGRIIRSPSAPARREQRFAYDRLRPWRACDRRPRQSCEQWRGRHAARRDGP